MMISGHDPLIYADLDLVQEMEWEEHVEFLSLEAAGLEEETEKQPMHGMHSCHDYIAWFSDGEDSRFESN